MTCIRGLRGIPTTPPLRAVPSRRDNVRATRWRRTQLIEAGLDELSAQRLAARTDVDIHAVLTLRDSGVELHLGRGDTSHGPGVDRRGTSRA